MISKIKWKNHKTLGNLELDFKKSDGTIYNTIVLAGDNGTGKTSILSSLAAFLNLGSIRFIDYIEYNVNNTPYTITNNNSDTYRENGFHERINNITGEKKQIFADRANMPNKIYEDIEDIRHYGVIYSKAKSGFRTNKITTTTTTQLDNEKYDIDSNDDYTNLKQLLVDVEAQDNSEWMKITKNKQKISFAKFKSQSRIHRFEKAFNNFFDNLKFEGIDNNNSEEKKIIFKKYNKDISIDELSTGEKQIVFRGAYLLKNVNGITGGIVLIDEPELSMHPKWQEKILDYYRGLFMKNGVQEVQLIIATHSEFLIKSALKDQDNILVITLKDKKGILLSNRIIAPNALPVLSSAEVNYLAFGIISNDYHNELFAYLQRKTRCLSVKSIDTYIANSPFFNRRSHEKITSYRGTQYVTICSYIRNLIDHPDFMTFFTNRELKKSIELLIKLCKLP